MSLDLELIQRHQLDGLLDHGYTSAFGRLYHFRADWSYEEFAEQVPISDYEEIKPFIEKAKQGKADQLWEGKVDRFAVSSGTTGTGKHLPVTKERLTSDRLFLKQIMWEVLLNNPILSLFRGRFLSLPGTVTEENRANHSYKIGEISGHLGEVSPDWLSLFQLLPMRELIQLPFGEKFRRVVETSLQQDIRVITAVPSWTLALFQQVLKKTGVSELKEIWPHLQLLVCGGVALRNYAPTLTKLYGKQITMIETYGASEGYFAFGHYGEYDDMKLVTDNGIFYEWIPLDSTGNKLTKSHAIPTWKAETGIKYVMLVSTNAGLWRYPVYDIIEFTRLNPPRIKVIGRLHEMLDEYGEALYLYEADEAMRKVQSQFNIHVDHYSVGAMHKKSEELPRHYWFVFSSKAKQWDTDAWAESLDGHLCQMNRHYSIRRQSEALARPVVISLPSALISKMNKFNVSAQSKPRRLLHHHKEIENLLDWQKEV